MTTAEAALRQLLADVEAANEWQRGETETKPALYDCRHEELGYLEKLARDGLADVIWRPAAAGWGVCTFWGPRGRCLSTAVKKNGTAGACEEHAVAMGAKAGT